VEGCGGYLSFANAGAVWKENDNFKCFLPGVHGLENIAEHYPNSTVMMFKFDAEKWIRVNREFQTLSRMGAYCDGAPSPARGADQHVTDAMWIKFHEDYLESIRAFAREHPSLTYIEVEVESKETPRMLEEATGLPANCYGHGLTLT